MASLARSLRTLGAVVAAAPAVALALAADADVVVAATIPQAQLYNCHAELDYWQTAWTPDWKAWCCEFYAKGCPTTITSTTTLTQSSTTTSVTSTSTVTTTITTTQTATSTTDTGTTRTETGTSTSTETQTSTTQIATPSTTQTSTTQIATPSTTQTETRRSPCQNMCTVDDMTASCAARIQWSSKHMTNDQDSPCGAARNMVTSQCRNECSQCTVEASGCEAVLHQDSSFQFRQKFEQPAAGVEVEREVAALEGRTADHLLPMNTAAGVMVAFLSSAVLAVLFRTRGDNRHDYQNLLTHEDFAGYDDEYSTSSEDLEGPSDLEGQSAE